MKPFRDELQRFEARLARHERFSLARFGDGEMVLLMGHHRRLARHIAGFEYQYEPGDPAYAGSRVMLLEAFRYRAPDYYVGIPCPHCVGDQDFKWMVDASEQDEEHLTYATLYYYSNFPYFLERVAPLVQSYQTILVCNRTASLDRLPFAVARDFRVGLNAWRDDHDLIDALQRFIERERVRDALFLLCAGPYGGILAHRLHAFRPENSYVDLGSAFDPFFFAGDAGVTRRYLRGGGLLEEHCDWRPLAESGLRCRFDAAE